MSAQYIGEIEMPTNDLNADMQFFIDTLGFRLETINPSDDPAVAVLSGHGLRLRLDRASDVAPGCLRLVSPGSSGSSETAPSHYVGKEAAETLLAPNGTRIAFVPQNDDVRIPPTEHQFQVRNMAEGDPWVIGRAGMLYRDLIDGRLGGSIIASHIRIPDGGPVPDMVHYHSIGFQLIYCLSGWVRLVYEDQGPEFILRAGDCVTQPPRIRHRVLESSDNLEVLEIGVPSDHMTTIDHDMQLPTAQINTQRRFAGQTFCRHQRDSAIWQPLSVAGLSYCNTGIDKATNNMASVQVVKATNSFQPTSVLHVSDIHFRFVVRGQLQVTAADTNQSGAAQTDTTQEHTTQYVLGSSDAMVIPPGTQLQFDSVSDDLEYIDIKLPA